MSDGISLKDDKEEVKTCGCDNSKFCVQLENIEDLKRFKEIMSGKMEEVEENMEVVQSKVKDMTPMLNTVVDAIGRLTANVDNTTENINKLYKVHYRLEVESVKGISKNEINISKNETDISKVRNESILGNALQDKTKVEDELSVYHEKSKDKKSLWQKAKITAVGLFVAYAVGKVTGLFDLAFMWWIK